MDNPDSEDYGSIVGYESRDEPLQVGPIPTSSTHRDIVWHRDRQYNMDGECVHVDCICSSRQIAERERERMIRECRYWPWNMHRRVRALKLRKSSPRGKWSVYDGDATKDDDFGAALIISEPLEVVDMLRG